jgi:ribosomal protein S15P/S13E
VYEAIREEFREHMAMNPKDEKTRQEIALAQRGLAQLLQFHEGGHDRRRESK